jgi:hypothetical protein
MSYRSAVEKHKKSLELSLRDVPLRLVPPWRVQGSGGRIRIPRASRDSILVCGGVGGSGDSGGDIPGVVAPYMFLRAARGADGAEIVDLELELRRCCLLRDCQDDRLLRGLLAAWSGALPDDGGGEGGEHVIDPDGRLVGGATHHPLPKVAERGDAVLRFVLTTRADSIRVALPTGHVLKVAEEMLDAGSGQLLDPDADRAVRPRWLDGAAAAAFAAFARDRVLPGVQVGFLFVKAGVSPLAATSTRQHCRE